jgi:cyclopropane fatty-acyl-phospholipid synthase-like methyltransferase
LKGLNKNAPILELGCGPGNFLEFLIDNGFTNAHGIDVSREQINIALSKQLSVQETDVFQFLTQNIKTYDTIVAIDLLEHFTKNELYELISLIARHLNDGGRLIISTPNGKGIFAGEVLFGDLTHMTIFTPQSLAQLLHAHGFDGVRCWETGPVAKNIAGFMRVAAWRVVRFLAKAARFAETGKRQDIWTETFLCMAYREDSCLPRSPDGPTDSL